VDVVMLMSDELGETAEKILQFIQTNPGCHLRKIKEMIHVSQGTVQYHTDRLEKNGNITSNRSGLYKHYFPVGVFQDNEKEILQILSQETIRQILMFIVEQQAPTQTDIVNSIGLSASSVNWHMRRLIDFRLVEEIKEGKYRRYQLRNRKVSSKYITALMRNYYPALWEKWSDRLIDIFLSISRGETKQ
jgi:predicted transcriptional regulator